MAYGILKCDTITFTDAGVDKSVTISGLVQNPTFSGNITVTGTVSGNTIQGQTVSGATITGGAAAFTTVTGGVATITSGVFALGSASNPSISFTGDANTGLYSPGADQVAISTGGSGRLFVDASGNVGVGSTPSVRLDVRQNQAAYSYFDFYNTTAGGGVVWRQIVRNLADTGTTSIDFVKYTSGGFAVANNDTGAANFTAFNVGASERLRITSAGLVGIGTSAPQNLLHLRSDSNSAVTQLYLMNRTSGASVESRIAFTTSANDLADNRHAYIGAVTTGAGANGNSFVIATNPDGGSAQTRVFVSSTGNVGIGTTSPNQPLHVVGNARFTAALLWAGTGATNSYLDGTTTGLLKIGSNDRDRIKINATEITFNDASSEFARIDSSGRLLVGTSSARANLFNSTIAPAFQLEGAGIVPAQRFLSVINNYATAGDGGGVIALGRSKGGTVGSNTVVANNDQLGRFDFQGNDGTEFVTGAAIEGYVDGTPGTNDMPGRLVFSTTADGASSPTERMRITSGGYLKASNNGAYNSSTATYHEHYQTSAGDANTNFVCSSSSYTGGGVQVATNTAAGTGFSYYRGYSSGFTDTEFNLRGDGTGLCDGSWTGGGADYAEYFEWSDSNPDAEDRRGISVVLDGDKIREAVAGEDPIGVISGNPSVVGDAAWNKWSGKYLRDEFGTYIQEDYEVEDEDGNTVIQQRRKLNPAYDPDVEYTSREKRPEWDCVGLMGKLRIRKGQVTGSRWIKMRDINDSVEEWLVR